jgi:L-rhamnose mutarotase
MRRFGLINRLLPEKVEEYKRIHQEVWPNVLSLLQECRLRNYSIYLKDQLLFSYFEYEGNDFEADFARIGSDPLSHRWEEHCKHCFEPPADPERRKQFDWWETMEEIFHLP